MDKIPTAEEYLKKYNSHEHSKSEGCSCRWRDEVAMREFAKLHVEAAIEACIEEAPSGSSTDTVSHQDVVKALKDCYPLTNIK